MWLWGGIKCDSCNTKSFKMKKKIFLISGGSSKIFQDLIQKNYFNNSNIVAIYNSSKNLFKTKNIKYLKIDYSKDFKLGEIEKLIQNYQKIIFINFAAKKNDKIILDIDCNDFLKSLKINTLSYFKICKFILPIMIKNKWGRIINISSTGGERGDVGTAVYTSSKLASNGITSIISKEFARFGITSNTIKLGNFNTGMFLSLNANKKKKILNDIPSKKTGKISNIYKAISFLVKSEYSNNAILNIDGGYR